MEQSASLSKGAAKAAIGALLGAALGYGLVQLAGFNTGGAFAIFGAIIGAGKALGLGHTQNDHLEGLEETSKRALRTNQDDDDDRTAGRGIYLEDF